MTQTTQTEYNEVLEYFTVEDRTLMFVDEEYIKNPVLIGDVIAKHSPRQTIRKHGEELFQLVTNWHQAGGTDLSLQEIVEGGWEENFMPVKRGDKTGDIIKVLKQPQSDLISFLHNLIYEN